MTISHLIELAKRSAPLSATMQLARDATAESDAWAASFAAVFETSAIERAMAAIYPVAMPGRTDSHPTLEMMEADSG